jgi:hypothetical protein
MCELLQCVQCLFNTVFSNENSQHQRAYIGEKNSQFFLSQYCVLFYLCFFCNEGRVFELYVYIYLFLNGIPRVPGEVSVRAWSVVQSQQILHRLPQHIVQIFLIHEHQNSSDELNDEHHK